MPPNDLRKRERRHRRVSSWLILVFKLTADFGHRFAKVLHKPAWTGDFLDR
jgi:hypothetical protein